MVRGYMIRVLESEDVRHNLSNLLLELILDLSGKHLVLVND